MDLQKLSKGGHGAAMNGTGDTAMKPKPARILSLPFEIFMMIAEVFRAHGEHESGYRVYRQISKLAKTCKGCYLMLTPILYKYDIKFKNYNSLYWGAGTGNLNVMFLGHLYGGNLNIRLRRTVGTTTLLHVAVQYNRLEVVRWLLDRGVDVNARSGSFDVCRCRPWEFSGRVSEVSWSPLHTAICNGYLRTAEELVLRGASLDVGGPQGKHTALHTAAWRGNLPVLEFLTKNSSIEKVNQQDHNGNTVLHLLSGIQGRHAIHRALDRLRPFGLEINKLNTRGDSPLAHACDKENFVLANCLLGRGADPCRTNPPRRNPMYLCITDHKGKKKRDSLKLLDALLSKGVDVDTRFNSEVTPLMRACHHMNLGALKRLLKGGASVDAKDSHGRTPLFYVNPSESRENRPRASKLIEILLRRGARLDARNLRGELFWLEGGGTWFERRLSQKDMSFLGVANKSHISQENLVKLIRGYFNDIKGSDSACGQGFQELAKLAKRTYGVHVDEIRGYMDTFINEDDEFCLKCLVSSGLVQFVMDQDEAYEINRLQNRGVAYYATETLAARALDARSMDIAGHVIREYKMCPAGKRFTGGRTLLHLVLGCFPVGGCDAWRLVRHLLERLGPEDIDAFDDVLETPLHMAVYVLAVMEEGQYELGVVRILMEAGAYRHVRPTKEYLESIYPEENEEKWVAKASYVTPFELAVRKSCLKMVELMLTTGSSALPDIPPKSKTSYVHMACKLDNPEILDELINHGADVHGGYECLDPPAEMLLRGIWEKNKARAFGADAVEKGMKHLRLLLDFERHLGKDEVCFAVPRQVRDRLQEVVEYDGQDGYKKGIKELIRLQLRITAVEGTVVHQSEDGKVTPIVVMESKDFGPSPSTSQRQELDSQGYSSDYLDHLVTYPQ